jgi:hypothetical protein
VQTNWCIVTTICALPRRLNNLHLGFAEEKFAEWHGGEDMDI